MSVYYLIPLIIILGAIVYYIYYLEPRLNPLNKAQNFVKQNMIEEAIIEYRKILENDPMNSLVHYRLGQLYFDQNKIDQGIIHFEDILNINKFNFEVDKTDVLRTLGKAYLFRDEVENAFQIFLDILNIYPNDEDALYYVSFISLGQELFEFANKHFDRLVKVQKKSFEILFGAGIASYQEQKINDSVKYFKEALALEPHSDIGNIAIGFALQRKRDFKTAVKYLQMVIDNSEDNNAIFIAKRLVGVILTQSERYKEALEMFQDILDFTGKNDMKDEKCAILYDLGFVCIRAEKTDMAYDYWNQAYQIDRNYKNVQRMVTILRKEMENLRSMKPDPNIESASDHVENWIKDAFPENYLWKICGLKSDREIDLKSIRIVSRISSGKGAALTSSGGKSSSDPAEAMERFLEIDLENFRIVANRIVHKLGYNVEEILNTYRDSDGVDFLAKNTSTNKTALIWVRRWKGTKVGEIPLRNFAQAINDFKAAEGLFITTTELNAPAEASLKRLSKVKVIYPERLGDLLMGML